MQDWWKLGQQAKFACAFRVTHWIWREPSLAAPKRTKEQLYLAVLTEAYRSIRALEDKLDLERCDTLEA